MADIDLYRIARNGEGMSYGPYDRLSSARNVAANVYGGNSWEGVNQQVIECSTYDWKTGVRGIAENRFSIQKLTPVFKQGVVGSFTLSMEWIDLA